MENHGREVLPAGRPRKYTKKRLKEIEQKIIAYTEQTALPIVAECAYELGMHRQQLYEFPEINDAVKKLITKKESVLEKGALSGKLNPSMAIFSLKQIGWSDQQHVNHSGNIDTQAQMQIYLPENGRGDADSGGK